MPPRQRSAKQRRQPPDLDQRIAGALRSGRPITVATIAKRSAATPARTKRSLLRLEKQGLVRQGRSKDTWRAATTRATKPSGKTSTVADRLESLTRRVELLERYVLDRSIAGAVTSPTSGASPAQTELVRMIVVGLASARRSGGLAHVADVRRIARDRSSMPAVDVDAALLELDKTYAVDLKVANTPTALSDTLEVPGRGITSLVLPRT